SGEDETEVFVGGGIEFTLIIPGEQIRKAPDSPQGLAQVVGCHGSELLEIAIRSDESSFGAASERHIFKGEKNRVGCFVLSGEAAAVEPDGPGADVGEGLLDFKVGETGTLREHFTERVTKRL